MWIWHYEYFSLRQQIVLLVLALAILFLLSFRFDHRSLPSVQRIAREVVVEVSGGVRCPGIYLFQTPPTLDEAIKRAGGLKESALFDTASSSVCLETGTLIAVTRGNPLAPSPVSSPKIGTEEVNRGAIKVHLGRMEAKKLVVFSIPLDLNRVSAEDLCLIPGIGESLAQEIISYRERRKAFRSIEELKKIKTIGEKRCQSLKPYLTIR